MDIEKEDGTNDYLICQLKSTDAQSIRVQQKDIRMLEHNAAVEHKIPIFAIQFLNTGEVWLMAKPADFESVAQYLDLGYIDKTPVDEIVGADFDSGKKEIVYTIKSSCEARNEYNKEQSDRYNKIKSAT